MKVLGIIPARFASTRFPGKPLVLIDDQPMVWHVYQRAVEAGLDEIMVATDDERIEEAVLERGGKVMMTSSEHLTGTDRCGEVVRKLLEAGQKFDFVINIQGDEPFIDPEQIRLLKSGLEKGKISTLIKALNDPNLLANPNVIKVAFSKQLWQALYFSRLPIPYWRSAGNPVKQHQYYKHIGMYGFDADLLLKLVELSPSPLELAESLEQLRWMEHGYLIKVIETHLETRGIDSPDDLERLGF